MASAPRFQFVAGSSEHSTYRLIGWVSLVVLLVIVAFAYNDTASLTILDNEYSLGLTRITKAIAFILALLGLQVVAGFTGQLSLGQGFFFGTGAYITAYLVQDKPLFGWNYFTSLIVVVPVCFLLGMLFGIPALRIKGLYLALVTLGLAAVFPALVQLQQLQEYTNGAGGKLIDADIVAPSWLPLDGIAGAFQSIPLIGQYFGDGDLSSREEDRIWIFFLMTIVAVVCFKMVSNMIASRPGRAMRAIRDNETSAAVSGIDLSLYKTLSFGVASALGGVGGMVYVAELGIAAPLDFTQLLSILFIVGLIVGGAGTLSGAVVGGLVLAFVPEWASSTESLPGVPERWLQGPTGTLFLGLLLIVLMFVLPGGVIAGVRQLRARFVQIIPQAPGAAAAAVAVDDAASEEIAGDLDDEPSVDVAVDESDETTDTTKVGGEV
ncbi:MAG: branched-chain amino acid ABC transporter permease [Actinomycetota bacterium]